jgi:peptidoglycan/LPS O-acetylase OafA/YrhL
MDLRRLRAGEWVAAAAAVALLVSLFSPWFGAGAQTLSAWEALAANDVLLAFVAASGVLLAIMTATQRVPAVSIALAGLVTLAGLVGVVLVLVRVLDLPEPADGREWGLWLALAGAAGIVVGGVLSMRDERLSKPGRPTDATGRPAPPPPEIERIPAPRP